MKRKIFVYALGLLVVAVLSILYVRKNQAQQNIASQIIRFHVIANSDQDKDQRLKLSVKDRVVKYLQVKLAKAESLDEARSIIRLEMENIENEAKKELEKNGSDASVSGSLCDSYFPVKKYGDLTFPAGEYQALKIEIGRAKGKNWWCVLYPSLCFLDSTYQVVPDESKERLKDVLDEDDYRVLLGGDEKLEFGFKLFDWLDKLH